jgi:4'-phosphopantetheinyl transferase
VSTQAQFRDTAAAPSGTHASQLWCVDLGAVGPALRAMEQRTPRLCAADRQRADAFSDRVVRDEWLATHIALRLLIERAAGPQWRGATFARSDRGKPHLEGATIAFSLSHAPGLALIGIAREGSIGVDVERARCVRVDAGRRERIAEAGATLAAAPLPADADARLLQAWVRLEAYAKADGCGLGRLLTRLGILGRSAAAREAPGSVRERVELMLRDPQSPKLVADLDLGDDTFAAVASSNPAAISEPAWLPTGSEDLEKLLI